MEPRVEAVIALMRRDLRRKLALTDMARAVNLTPFHFSRLFKAETGGPPAKYFKQLRLCEARRMLESTFLSVKEITAAVGFRDESHFVRDFRAHRADPTTARTDGRGRARAESFSARAARLSPRPLTHDESLPGLEVQT
ncbi:MAG: helix-turn-helix domain-containing protein [Acidobacteria bacterium]|nr:helix-turn-helix domain-containing protein [Acidobacteriota bacterium]